MAKYLTLITGKPGNRQLHMIEYDGKLTPGLAVEAAKKAFGHANGVTVRGDGKIYRCTNDKARLIKA